MYLNTPQDEVSLETILENKDKYIHWDYQNDILEVSTGYEDLYDELSTYNMEYYTSLGVKGEKRSEAQLELIDKVASIYRERNIFPTYYLSPTGVSQEILKCIEYNATWDGDTVQTGVGVGSLVCNFLFPNLFNTPSAQEGKVSDGSDTMLGKFYSDKYLRKAIQFCYSYKDGVPLPSPLMGGLRMIGSAPSNFRPMNAKAIYERFCPEGGVIYDMSCGFGGRMLGALSSKNNYTYVGTDPNMESMYNLHRLGKEIEKVTGRSESYELHCCGSELPDLVREDNQGFADFAFSSPPYFCLEDYDKGGINTKNQSHNKYPELEGWLEGYVRGTVRNLKKILKPGAYYAVNIADFNLLGKGMVSFVDSWKQISEEEGLPYFTNVYLGVTARSGSLEQIMGENKKEIIMIFKNQEDLW